MRSGTRQRTTTVSSRCLKTTSPAGALQCRADSSAAVGKLDLLQRLADQSTIIQRIRTNDEAAALLGEQLDSDDDIDLVTPQNASSNNNANSHSQSNTNKKKSDSNINKSNKPPVHLPPTKRRAPDTDDPPPSNRGAVRALVHLSAIGDAITKIEAELKGYKASESRYHLKDAGMSLRQYKEMVGAETTKIFQKLPSLKEVMENIEDWYIDADPAERNRTGAKTENMNALQKTKDVLETGAKALKSVVGKRHTDAWLLSTEKDWHAVVAIAKEIDIWGETGGGFSAVGRATETSATVGAVNPDLTRFSVDDTFLGAFSLGRGSPQKGNSTKHAYKETGREQQTGTLHVDGLLTADTSLLDKAQKLKTVEQQIKPLDTSGKTVAFSRPMVAQDRGKGQFDGMGKTNARGYAWLVDTEGWNTSRWEWLHVRGAALGGATDGTNLVLGTRDANTLMMPFEANLRTLSALVSEHADLDQLKVSWAPENRKSLPVEAMHFYQSITVTWDVVTKPTAKKSTSDLADKTSGTLKVDVLNGTKILSKSEVKHIQDLLKDTRESMHKG